MKSTAVKFVAAITMVVGATAAMAQVGVYTQVGTSGVGIGVAYTVSDSLALRGELNAGFNVDTTGSAGNVNYKSTGNIGQDAGLFVDWYPSGGSWRVVGGLLMSATKVTLASAPGTYSVNGTLYTTTAADQLIAEVKYPDAMPYLGVGWGHASAAKGWGFIADLGVGVGSLGSTLRQTGTLAIAAADLAAEKKKLEDAVNKVSFYPVVRVGVNYRF